MGSDSNTSAPSLASAADLATSTICFNWLAPSPSACALGEAKSAKTRPSPGSTVVSAPAFASGRTQAPSFVGKVAIRTRTPESLGVMESSSRTRSIHSSAGSPLALSGLVAWHSFSNHFASWLHSDSSPANSTSNTQLAASECWSPTRRATSGLSNTAARAVPRRLTASPSFNAVSDSEYSDTRTSTARGLGCRRNQAPDITPNVPKLPVYSFARSYPVTFFTTRPPHFVRVPEA